MKPLASLALILALSGNSVTAEQVQEIYIPYQAQLRDGRIETYREFVQREYDRLKVLQTLFGNTSNGCMTEVVIQGYDPMCITIPLKSEKWKYSAKKIGT